MADATNERAQGCLVRSAACIKRKSWACVIAAAAVCSACLVLITFKVGGVKVASSSLVFSPVEYKSTRRAPADRRRFIVLRKALAHASHPSTFVNPNSPQSLALKWLAYQDNIIDIMFASDNSTKAGNVSEEALPLVERVGYRWKLEQRYALMVLSFSTCGESWRGIVPWENHVDIDECSAGFQGVGCDPFSSRVSQIQLVHRSMAGHLPDEIGLLTQLTKLDLTGNALEGRIPHSLYHRLTNLEHLLLAGNEIAFEIQDEIGNLVRLKSLFLSNTFVSGTLPDAMGNLTELKELEISNNFLHGDFLRFVSSWPDLEFLSAARTEGLTGTIPTAIGLATGLTELIIVDTHVHGSIPSELGSATKLETLVLGGHFSGVFPTALMNCERLRALVISPAPGLQGSISSVIGDLTHLSTLVFSSTSMEGRLPTELGRLTGMETLNLENSNFVGTFPSELGEMKALTNLQLNGNSIVGTVPQAICDLQGLAAWLNCVGNDLVCENGCCSTNWCV